MLLGTFIVAGFTYVHVCVNISSEIFQKCKDVEIALTQLREEKASCDAAHAQAVEELHAQRKQELDDVSARHDSEKSAMKSEHEQ